MKNTDLKRSKEPIVWLLFGVGGMVSAIVFPILLLIVGFLLPFGLIDAYNIIDFSHTFIGKLILLVVLIFPAWCGLHRVRHALHDFKINLPTAGPIFYGLASLYTILALLAIIAI